MLRFGYNTNGFAHHRLEDCFEILAELGYAGVAITVDVQHLNPETTSTTQLRELRRLLEKLKLEPTIETGARFLLDPRRKHQPTLLDLDPAACAVRLDFLKDCVSIGAELGAKVVSFWSGKLPEASGSAPEKSAAEAQKLLAQGCRTIVDFAAAHGMRIGFEPEPGMLVESIPQFRALRKEVGDDLGLALDVGHCYCTYDLPIAKIVEEFRDTIVTAALEDIRGGKHEHLPLGEGEINFREVLRAFESIDYRGLLSLELSRDSHRAPDVARKSMEFLTKIAAGV